jgi:hypothetical protein
MVWNVEDEFVDKVWSSTSRIVYDEQAAPAVTTSLHEEPAPKPSKECLN